MNCECIYTIKNATIEKLEALAEQISDLELELYPVSIAQITKDTDIAVDYDGYGNHFILNKGAYVLFAEGKYHCMNDYYGAKPFFPQDRSCNWFKDIKMM